MKNKQAIYLLFAANSISGASQGISMIAIPWYLVHILDREPALGISYGIITFISFFWGLYAGTLIDRFDRRNIFIYSSVAGFLIVTSAAILGYILGQVPLAAASVVFGTTIFIYNIHYPNLYAFGQEITEKKHYSKINSYLEIQGQLTNAFAGGIAALLLSGLKPMEISLPFSGLSFQVQIEAWKLHEIFLLDGITYILSIILLSFIRYKRLAQRHIASGSIAGRLKVGLSYLRKHPLILIFGTASYTIFVTILITGFFLMALYVDNHLQKAGNVYAIAEVVYALGSLLAGLAIYRIFRSRDTVQSIIIMIFISAMIFYIQVMNRQLLLFFLTYTLLGTCNAGTRIMRMTFLFNHVPNSVIGRCGSVFNSANVLMRLFFIGLFSTPFFSRDNHVIYAFLILAIFLVISGFVLLYYYPAIRKLPEGEPSIPLGGPGKASTNQ